MGLTHPQPRQGCPQPKPQRHSRRLHPRSLSTPVMQDHQLGGLTWSMTVTRGTTRAARCP